MRLKSAISILGLFLILSGFKTFSLTDVVSVIQQPDGKFSVLCKDHSQEVVSEQDILDNNVCPYIAPPSNKGDLLIVIDNSGSMGSSQNDFSGLAADLISDLSNKYDNFKIAVTTTDAYSNGNNSFKSIDGYNMLTQDTSDIENKLSKLINQGVTGSGDERAIDSIEAVLNNSANPQLIRDDSFFHILVLSDEDDNSLKSNIDFYNDMSQLTKSEPNNLKFNVTSIAIFDEACLEAKQDTFTGRKMAYRLGDLSDMTDGLKISLCDIQGPFF